MDWYSPFIFLKFIQNNYVEFFLWWILQLFSKLRWSGFLFRHVLTWLPYFIKRMSASPLSHWPPVLISSGCYSRNTIDSYQHLFQFWRLEVQGQGARMIELLVKAVFLVTDGHLLVVSSHGGERDGMQVILCLFLQGHWPQHESPTLMT